MPKSYSNAQLRTLASKLGKSVRTLRYWAKNCDLEDEESLRQFAGYKAIKGRQTAKARMARKTASRVESKDSMSTYWTWGTVRRGESKDSAFRTRDTWYIRQW